MNDGLEFLRRESAKTDMLKAYNPHADVVRVRLLHAHGHFLGEQTPAGSVVRACFDTERNLYDCEMLDGNLIRVWPGDVEVINEA